MKTSIYLNNQMQFNLELPSFNPSEFTKNVNNPQIQIMNIGSLVLNKNAIMFMAPTEEEVNANLEIHLSNNMIIKTFVEDFNAVEFASGLNNPQVVLVSIGKVVINKNVFTMAMPIEPTVTETV